MHWQTMLTRVDKEVLKQKNCKNFHAHKKKKFLFKYLPRILHIVVLVIIKVDAQIRGAKVAHIPAQWFRRNFGIKVTQPSCT